MPLCNTQQSTIMSDLYRSAMSARLNKLPPPETVAPYSDEDMEEEEDEIDNLGSLPSFPPPGLYENHFCISVLSITSTQTIVQQSQSKSS